MTPNSRPSRTRVAPTSAQRSTISAITSSDWIAVTTVAPALMMPTFSRAMAAGVSPRYFAWSTAIGVSTATFASITLVASQAPPMPTSTTAASTGASAKAAYAIPTTVSKNDSGWSCSPSTRWVYGATSLNARTNASSLIGSPSRLIRSVIDSRCGLVNRPTRSPSAPISVSIIRAVDVLPLVPVRWIDG